MPAAFGEQNKIDNDSKCQQVYKSLKNTRPVHKELGEGYCNWMT